MKDLFTVNIVGAWQSYANHTEESKRDVSICFVSGDEYEEGFAESEGIPFLRLPFSSKKIRGKLHDNFQITGYPGLIVVNLATGEVVTRDGCRQLFVTNYNNSLNKGPPINQLKNKLKIGMKQVQN